MATVAHVSMDDGLPVAYGNADIDYLVDEANDYTTHNRPLANLSERDVRNRDKLNEVIDRHNAAWTGTTFLVPNSDAGHAAPLLSTLEEFTSIEHNADGTHKGGSPHGPAVYNGAISGFTAELKITNVAGQQQMQLNLDDTATSLCAGDDSRLHDISGGWANNTDHDGRYVQIGQTWAYVGAGFVYATPKAAIDAGEDSIIVTSGTYNDGGVGVITLTKPITMIGIGDVTWTQDVFAIPVAGARTTIENIEFDNGVVNISANNVQIKHCRAVNTVAPGAGTLNIFGCDNLLIEDFKAVPSAGVNGIEIGTASHVTIERFDCTAIRSTAGFPVSGIEIKGPCNDLVFRDIDAEFGAVGSSGVAQKGIHFTQSVNKLVIDGLYTTWCTEAVHFDMDALAFQTLRDVWIKRVRYRDGRFGDVGTWSKPIRIDGPGASFAIRRMRIHDVHAQGALSEDAFSGVGIVFNCAGATSTLNDIEISDFVLHGESGTSHGIYFYVPNGEINRLMINDGHTIDVGTGVHIIASSLDGFSVAHLSVVRDAGCAAVIIEDTLTTDVTLTDLSAVASAGNAFGFTYTDNVAGASKNFSVENLNVIGQAAASCIAMRVILGAGATLTHYSASCGTVMQGAVFSLLSNDDVAFQFGVFSEFVCETVGPYAYIYSGAAYTFPTINLAATTYKTATGLANLAGNPPFNDAGSSFAHL